MLVIAKKRSGTVTLFTPAGPVKVMIVESGNTVRLGFEAPPAVRIRNDDTQHVASQRVAERRRKVPAVSQN